jgi:hypothetical protein
MRPIVRVLMEAHDSTIVKIFFARAILCYICRLKLQGIVESDVAIVICYIQRITTAMMSNQLVGLKMKYEALE